MYLFTWTPFSWKARNNQLEWYRIYVQYNELCLSFHPAARGSMFWPKNNIPTPHPHNRSIPITGTSYVPFKPLFPPILHLFHVCFKLPFFPCIFLSSFLIFCMFLLFFTPFCIFLPTWPLGWKYTYFRILPSPFKLTERSLSKDQ